MARIKATTLRGLLDIVRRSREQLRQAEWAGLVSDDEIGCPECKRYLYANEDGHADDCKLLQLLKDIDDLIGSDSKEMG